MLLYIQLLISLFLFLAFAPVSQWPICLSCKCHFVSPFFLSGMWSSSPIREKQYRVQTLPAQLYSVHLHNICPLISRAFTCTRRLMIVHAASRMFSWGWRKLDFISASAPLLQPKSQDTRSERALASRRDLARAAAVLTSFLGILGVLFLYLDVLKRFMLSCWSRVWSWTFRVCVCCESVLCVWMRAFVWRSADLQTISAH